MLVGKSHTGHHWVAAMQIDVEKVVSVACVETTTEVVGCSRYWGVPIRGYWGDTAGLEGWQAQKHHDILRFNLTPS